MPERGNEELRAEFLAACRRVDDDPREQQRINEIAGQFDAENALYSRAVAAADRGDAVVAVPMLRQCAEAGIGEAAWLLAQLLEDAGNATEAMTWYQRAFDDGDIRAAGKLAGLRAPRRRPVVPGMIQGQGICRAVDNTVDTSVFLADPGRDLRIMSRGDREQTKAVIARLRELLRWCPAGAFGPEGSATVLASVAMVSEDLIADRDERTALRLIRAASPHLAIAGRASPAAFGVRRARANALCELGHYQLAEKMLRRLSTDEERVFGTDDPRTSLLRLWALVSGGRLREAEAGFRALDALLAQPQGASMMLWHLRCRRSWLLGQQGLASESEAGYDGVIINRSHELGADHPDTGDARHSKGKMRVFAGDGSQVITLLQSVADDRARVQGDSHPDTLETLKYLHLARVQSEPRDDRVLDHAITSLEHILHAQDGRHGTGYPMSQDTVAWLRKLLQLREAIRFGEPVPELRQVPTPDSRKASEVK